MLSFYLNRQAERKSLRRPKVGDFVLAIVGGGEHDLGALVARNSPEIPRGEPIRNVALRLRKLPAVL